MSESVAVESVLEKGQPSSDELVALRDAICADAGTRKRVADYIAQLPSDDAAGAADAKLAAKKGLALWSIGRERHAIGWLQHSASDVAKEFLARSLVACGRPGEALKVLGDAAGSGAAALAAEAHANLGDADAAREQLKNVDAKAEPASAAYLRGRIADLDGDRDDAVTAYNEAVDLDATHGAALFRLAYGAALYGTEEETIELYRRSINTPCPPVNAYLNLGNLYEDRGEFTRARECYGAVVSGDPENVRARMFHRDASASMNMFYDEDFERRADRRTQVMRLPVTDFELSVRSRNCLAKMGVRSLGDLIQRSEQELLSYKNFGETSLQEIKDILAQKGLRLGMGRDGMADDEQARSILEGIGGDADRLKIMEKPLSELELSVRSRHCMNVLGLKSVGDLMQRSEPELMTIKNFGQTSLNEVKQKLAELGLTLTQGT